MASNKRLNATITIGGAITGALRSAFGTTSRSLTEIGKSVRQLAREQKMLESGINTFGRLGKNVDGLRERYASVTRELERMRRAQDRLANLEAKRQANLSRRAEIRGQMVDAVALGATAAAPIAAAVKFENAMLGVAKQLDGARDESGQLTQKYYDMAKAIQQLGRELPTSTSNIAEMVAAGLRMGVAGDQVLDFVRKTAEMSTAFELPEGELAENMGKIAALYKIPIPAIGELADTINYLDDNAISKGGDIIGFMQRVGGIAASVKITDKDMAALGSTLLTLGERTETASTAVNAIIQKFAGAEMGSNKFIGTMEELGLNVTDIAKGMQTDVLGTIEKVMAAISKKEAHQQVGFLSNLVGLEHSDTFAKLANNLGELRRQQKLANSEAAKGSMSREFQARMQTTNAQWEVMKNRVNELAVNIGSVLLPALNKTMGAIGPIVSKVAEWARENPRLVQTVVGIGTALVSLRLGTLAVGYAMTFVRGAVIAVGRAFMLNPIGAAVAAIGASAYLIYENWGPIKEWFGNLWDSVKVAWGDLPAWLDGLWSGITSKATEAWGSIKETLGFDPIAAVSATWGGITAWFGGVWSSITGSATAAWETVKATLSFDPIGTVSTKWDGVKTYFVRLWDEIMGTVHKAISWITSKIDWVGEKWRATKEFFGFGDEAGKDVGATVSNPDAPPSWTSSLPPPPQIAGVGGATSQYTDNSQNTYQIVQQPGENQDQLARRVAAEIERQRQVRQRSNAYDGATP